MLTNSGKCCLKFLAATATKTTGAIFSLSLFWSPVSSTCNIPCHSPARVRQSALMTLTFDVIPFLGLLIQSSLCPPTKHQPPPQQIHLQNLLHYVSAS